MKVTVGKRLLRGKRVWFVDWKPAGGKRQRKVKTSRDAAEALADQIRQDQRLSGEAWLAASGADRTEIISILHEIAQAGLTLRQVWQAYGGAPKPATSVTLATAIAETVNAKRAANLRAGYVKGLEQYLNLFARGREALPVGQVSTADLEAWFAGRKEANETRHSNAGRLSAMFGYCVRREYIAKNPCDGLEAIRLDARPPEILKPEDAERLLTRCREAQPRLLGWLALALLGGLRPDEAGKLSWGSLDLKSGLVTVDAAASKVRARRIVHLMPSAVAWLKVARAEGELPIAKITRRRCVRALRDWLGWQEWPQDILRHTAASYWLAEAQDAGKVAHELGNSASILLRRYRELVTKDQAAAFWAIMPT